jgi:ABC-2 type transport system ATP-binding protein
VTVQPGRVVILDEPTNDVDPLRRRLLWDQIRALGERGCAVFLVTHNVMEAERSVDRLAVIAAGRLIAQGTPSSLKAQDRGHLPAPGHARSGSGWAEELIGRGVAEEYALGATALEDVYIRLTGQVSADGHREG